MEDLQCEAVFLVGAAGRALLVVEDFGPDCGVDLSFCLVVAAGA